MDMVMETGELGRATRVGGTKSQCPVCKTFYSRKDYTLVHMKKKHPEEAQLPENRSLGGSRRDYCDFCKKLFANLSNHKRNSCRLNPNSVWSKKQLAKRLEYKAKKTLLQPKFIAAPVASQQISSLDIPDDPSLVQQVQSHKQLLFRSNSCLKEKEEEEEEEKKTAG
jgi:hypothetical protein